MASDDFVKAAHNIVDRIGGNIELQQTDTSLRFVVDIPRLADR
jgi:hypothetical protein